VCRTRGCVTTFVPRFLTACTQDKGHDAVAITSPTGAASYCCIRLTPIDTLSLRCAGVSALGIDGQTLHSFAGCGVPNRADDFGKMFAKKNRPKWDKLEVLIIDEISMVQVRVASCSHITAQCMFPLLQSLTQALIE